MTPQFEEVSEACTLESKGHSPRVKYGSLSDCPPIFLKNQGSLDESDGALVEKIS